MAAADGSAMMGDCLDRRGCRDGLKRREMRLYFLRRSLWETTLVEGVTFEDIELELREASWN